MLYCIKGSRRKERSNIFVSHAIHRLPVSWDAEELQGYIVDYAEPLANWQEEQTFDLAPLCLGL